jgi:hypothetical protein
LIDHSCFCPSALIFDQDSKSSRKDNYLPLLDLSFFHLAGITDKKRLDQLICKFKGRAAINSYSAA